MPRTIISLFLAVENGRWTPARDFMSYILIPFATALDFYNISPQRLCLIYLKTLARSAEGKHSVFTRSHRLVTRKPRIIVNERVIFFHKNRELSRLNENRLINIVSVRVTRYTVSFPFFFLLFSARWIQNPYRLSNDTRNYVARIMSLSDLTWHFDSYQIRWKQTIIASHCSPHFTYVSSRCIKLRKCKPQFSHCPLQITRA